MSDEHVLKTIDLVQAQVRDLEQQLAEKKRVINDLCKLISRAPIFAETNGSSTVVTAIRPDEFYGKPLATAVRSILEKRAAANLGAATVAELYDALVQGGMAFEAKNDANAKRGLYVSLSKNPAFHKLPNGTYGLTEWYPSVKGKKEANGADAKPSAQVADEPPVTEADESDADATEEAEGSMEEAEPVVAGRKPR